MCIGNQMYNLPDELIKVVKDFVIFKPTIKHELKRAVDLWCEDKAAAKAKYGDISIWDTSLIIDMERLFYDKHSFNDDINDWDVSNVLSMDGMFWDARAFNQSLDKWNVSKVTNMWGMYRRSRICGECFEGPAYLTIH